MKTVRNSRIGYGLIIMVLLPILNSCYDHEFAIVVPADYFPLSENTQADYRKEMISTADNETVWASDTVTLTVSGDTLIDGLTYKTIKNEFGLVEKVVRNDGSKYYGRNHEVYSGFSKEYLFLDTNLPVNGSWEHIKDEGQTKTEYVVKEVNATHVVNGIEYKDVIKMEVNYYDTYTDGVNFEFRFSVKHYYASGVGEIYAYYPYPASGLFSNLNISILPSQNN